ncbi:MAG: hypothetical protein DRO07_00390 [Candidatus Iainarchaeum archaeon]|uniref:Uncharacterized protein n=1 Tax=Candidatus Iainarchaeum sp. TaxID=3101447 RepID=A0A497JH28_9ARCH|nr:MAG: hypothetical protein DRO07_00390 [Candidatus Diapherotrites archaeon]
MSKSKAKKTTEEKTVKKNDIAKGKTAKKRGEEKKQEQAVAKKSEKKVEKGTKETAKEEKKKNKEIKKLQKKIKKKKKKPIFRGHFGKRSIRRKSRAKWDKWRVPRGADFKLKKEDGKAPSTGYRTSKALRYLHPSGYREVLIHNAKELEMLAGRANVAARIASTVGRKKRGEIIKKADEIGIKILNA